MPHHALLIDDEATARADLRAKLALHPEVTILAEAATMKSARALLARDDYDLVFLDVQLIGGNAFDLVPDVRPGARIIFATAYDSYALRAFEINALDYLLKPVVPARLTEALRRLTAGSQSPEKPAEEMSPGAMLHLDDTLYLRSGLRARFAAVATISAIAAHDNYSEVQLADGERIFLRKSLSEWERTLPNANFMRVHRTHVVNLARIVRYERDREERTLLYVEGASAPIPASRDRWNDLRARLAGLHSQP